MTIIALLHLLVYLITSARCFERHEYSICLTSAIGTPQQIDKLPILGFKDFLNYTDAYVDKTLLIKEILQHPSKVLLIACPRRWGKSLNLNMLRTFFEIQPGTSPRNQTDNYKLFKYGQLPTGQGPTKNLKPPFLISKHDDILDQHQGKYPVIYLNFLDRTSNDYMESIVGLVHGIHEAYTQHDYIRLWLQRRMNDFNNTNDMEREQAKEQYLKFVRIRDHVNTRYAENLHDLEISILYLSELLRRYHGRRVLVLIDEYETPVNMQLLNIVYPEDLDKITDFFRNFFHFTFNLNDHLEKAVLTGIAQPCYEKWLSQVDGLTIYDARINKLTEFYGFTREEVESLFEHFKIPSDRADEAHLRYNGYTMYTTTIETYNPWSIVNFLNNGTVHNYWEKTGDATMLTFMFALKSLRWKFHTLLQGGFVAVNFDRLYSTRPEFLEFKHLTHTAYENCELAAEHKPHTKLPTFRPYNVSSSTVDTILSYLWTTGYLTNSGDSHQKVRLPNNEVQSEMMLRMIHYYRHVEAINIEFVRKVTSQFVDFITSESTTDVELQKNFETLFEDMKVICADNHVDEDALHTTLDMIALLLRQEHEFMAETRVESSRVLMLLSKRFFGVIMAFQFNMKHIDHVLEIAISYQQFYKKQSHIQIIKFVGLGVTPQRRATIKAGFLEKE